MPSRLDHEAGRRLLVALVLFGLIASLLVLYFVVRDNDMKYDEWRPTLDAVLLLYLPLIAIATGFYFKAKAIPADQALPAGFYLSLVIVALWTLTPPILIFGFSDISAFVRMIGDVSKVAQPLVASAITFHFNIPQSS